MFHKDTFQMINNKKILQRTKMKENTLQMIMTILYECEAEVLLIFVSDICFSIFIL